MTSMMGDERRSFPELVGQHAQQAAAYVAAQGSFFYIMYHSFLYDVMSGFQPQILRENDPMTKDLRMNRVRIIVDPTRTVVIRTPVVG